MRRRRLTAWLDSQVEVPRGGLLGLACLNVASFDFPGAGWFGIAGVVLLVRDLWVNW